MVNMKYEECKTEQAFKYEWIIIQINPFVKQ